MTRRRSADAQVLVAAPVLLRQVEAILTAWGAGPETAATTAAVMVDTDLSGIDSHGVSMLPGYERLRERGLLDLTARPVVVRSAGVTGVVDAQGGLGHSAAVLAMELAAEKAVSHGIGAVAVRNSRHFGAAGYYARLASARGLLGLVTTSARTRCVTPTLGRDPKLATNPLAFAAPAGERDFVLDMSTSTVAVNKVKVHGYRHRPLPAGWVLDADGAPVCDPEVALASLRATQGAGLTPLGGTAQMGSHKGYGLSVMVQLLSAALSGTPHPPEGTDAAPVGHFLLAIDPQAFAGTEIFTAEATTLLDGLRATTPLDPQEPVLVAGDREAECRARRRTDGIPIPTALGQELRTLCLRADVPFLLESPCA